MEVHNKRLSSFIRGVRIWFLRSLWLVGLLVVSAGASTGGLAAEQPSRSPGADQPLTQTFSATADAELDSGKPAVNYGSRDSLSVGYFSGDGAANYRGLVRFDISSIPAEAVVVEASLNLYAENGTPAKQILVRRLTADWGEMTVNWNNQPPGQAPQASRLVDEAAGTYAWNVRQAVQGWVSGTYPNYGLGLQAANQAENGYRNFRTREATQAVPGVDNVRLVITWMPPAGPTDPGTPPPDTIMFLPVVMDTAPNGPVAVEVSPCPVQPPWVLRRGMNETYYQQSATALGAAGFRPVSVTASGEGDQARFNSLWVQDGLYGDNWSLQHDLTGEELQTQFDTLKAQGFRPSLVDAYGQGANTRYVAAWVKDNLPTSMMHGFPRDDFTSALVYSDTLKGWTLAPESEGWRPLWVSVNGPADNPLFSAIFARDELQGVLDFDKTAADLLDLRSVRTDDGYRLLHLSGYQVTPDPNDPNDDGIRYAASWVKDPDECGYVKWQVLERQTDVQLDMEALNASSLRQKTFSSPTLVVDATDLQNDFRRTRLELSSFPNESLAQLTRIEASSPGVLQDGDVLLLQARIGEFITVKETTDGNIDLLAPDNGPDGGQKFVLRGYNYRLALQYDAGNQKWVEIQRNNLPHERYFPISVDAYDTDDGLRYSSVWVQASPDRSARITYTPGDDPTYFNTLDDAMLSYMQKRDVPGGALAVTKDGRLVMARGYTWEPDGTANVAPDAIFRLASVSKALTAAGLVRLLDQKGYSLDTPLNTILGGGWNSADYQLVTLRDLLNHLGGWDRDIAFDPMFIDKTVCEFNEQPLPNTPQEIIDYMKTQEFQHRPGTVFSYSNFGYSLLGRVIEALSGQTYYDYMRNNLMIPFGMLDTWPGRNYESEAYWKEVEYYTPHNVMARDKNDGTAVDSNFVCDANHTQRVLLPYGGYNIDALDAHGGWTSTAIDLNRFLVAINKGSLLNPTQFSQTFLRPPGLSPRILLATGSSTPEDKTIQAQMPGSTWTGLASTNQNLYVGKGHAKFKQVDFELSQVGAGYALVVEYWNGSAWQPLTSAADALVDETANLTVAQASMKFTPPDDWQPNSVGGIWRYWLRISTSATPSTPAEIDLLQPNFDNQSFYAFGWFVTENQERLYFKEMLSPIVAGDWIAGSQSKTVAKVDQVVVQSPPGALKTGYLLLEDIRGGPFLDNETIYTLGGGLGLTNGQGMAEDFLAHHDGILDGTRAFMYRRADGVTWAALFNMRVGTSYDPLYLPGGNIDTLVEREFNKSSLPGGWPSYDLFNP